LKKTFREESVFKLQKFLYLEKIQPKNIFLLEEIKLKGHTKFLFVSCIIFDWKFEQIQLGLPFVLFSVQENKIPPTHACMRGVGGILF
jgi:hypothetical protein